MYKLFFLQKRNIKKNNEYIMFSSYRMSLQFTKTIINKIKDNFYYKNLIIKYNKELIELYFKKYFMNCFKSQIKL